MAQEAELKRKKKRICFRTISCGFVDRVLIEGKNDPRSNCVRSQADLGLLKLPRHTIADHDVNDDN